MSSLANPLTLGLAVAFLITLALLIRSLFRQAGIQDAIKETTDEASSQMKLWEEFGQHLDEGVALVNADGKIEYANTALATMTGWPNRSAFNQELETIIHLQDEQAQTVPLPKTDKPEAFYCIGHDGRRTPVHAVRRPLNRPIGYSIVILQDATAESAEKELRHRLVNLSSFELRAPVTAIKGYASMLLEGDAGKLSKEVADYIQPIFESTDNLLQLVEDMASVEELSTKRSQTKKKPVDVMEFLKGLAPRLKEIAVKADRKLELHDAIIKSKLEIDTTQIGRLLAMLANTAARTAKPGSVVQLTAEESEHTIDLHFVNQGEPLPKQSQANVFDYAGGRGLDEGIGFYVAKQVIEAHHAFVTVNTKADGNVFIVSLPKVMEDKPAKPEPDQPSTS